MLSQRGITTTHLMLWRLHLLLYISDLVSHPLLYGGSRY